MDRSNQSDEKYNHFLMDFSTIEPLFTTSGDAPGVLEKLCKFKELPRCPLCAEFIFSLTIF